MRLVVDTKTDSLEEIKHAISLLNLVIQNGVVNEPMSQGMNYNSIPAQNPITQPQQPVAPQGYTSPTGFHQQQEPMMNPQLNSGYQQPVQQQPSQIVGNNQIFAETRQPVQQQETGNIFSLFDSDDMKPNQGTSEPVQPVQTVQQMQTIEPVQTVQQQAPSSAADILNSIQTTETDASLNSIYSNNNEEEPKEEVRIVTY